MCRHILILLPLIVAALELLSPVLPLGSSLFCVGLLAFIVLLVPKRCGLSDWPKVLSSALISSGGALATFVLANFLNLGPLVASAVVGLLGTVRLKEQDQLVLYLGAFVGMTPVTRFPSLGLLILAGILGGVLWEVLSSTWNGVGGRLGTVAAVAVLVVVLTLGGGL